MGGRIAAFFSESILSCGGQVGVLCGVGRLYNAASSAPACTLRSWYYPEDRSFSSRDGLAPGPYRNLVSCAARA